MVNHAGPAMHHKPISRRSFLAAAGAVAAALKFSPHSAFADASRQLRFYNWATYVGETTLEDFRRESGTRVQMDLFGDMAEMFAALRSGQRYDVIVPSDSYVDRLIRARMLQPLDRRLLPNIGNLDPAFMDAAFDPGRRYSLTYMWGTLGIGYRRSVLDREPKSWKWLFDSSRYSGRIALLDDPQLVIQMALRYLGYSINTIDAGLIREAAALLRQQKPHVKSFVNETGQDLLRDGEVDLALEWNGDMLQVMDDDSDLAYVVPQEGGLLWQDCLCIPLDAPDSQAAHAFIDYLLDAEVAAKNAGYIQYGTPNAAARALMPESYLQNSTIFPPAEVFARCEIAWYRGEGVVDLYRRLWDEITA